jgi:FKBP-type peptidyl-prolyl cis-trans isomerase
MRTLPLALLLVAVSAHAADEKKAPPATAPAAAAPADNDKALNAIGLSVAKSLEPLGLSAPELDKVLAGVREGAGGKAKALDEKAQENLKAFVQARMTAAAAKEKERGDKYADSIAKQKGAIKTASGAIVVPIKEGTGAAPTTADTVKVHYVGTLVDGTVFDSSRARNQPAEFPLKNVIPCWTEALQKMKVGGQAKVVCPSAIAYGERGSPPVIPGNATLTFEVELLDIVKEQAPATPAAK